MINRNSSNHVPSECRRECRRSLSRWGRKTFSASATAVLLAAGLLIGCASPTPAFDVASEAYVGPSLRIEPTDVGNVLVMVAPTPGWQITLDAVRENVGRQDVFVTIRRPSALFNYPERSVEQRLATMVTTTTPLATYVRVLPFDAPRNDESPYRLGPATNSASASEVQK
jgi:hypothetical protein